MPARVNAKWSGSVLRSLAVTKLPAAAVVRVSCDGASCPFKPRTLRGSGATLDVKRALGSAAARLRPGQTLSVAVSAHAFNGAVTRWKIKPGAAPKPVALCVPLGETQPRARC
jgi:hypothetical protein